MGIYDLLNLLRTGKLYDVFDFEDSLLDGVSFIIWDIMHLDKLIF